MKPLINILLSLIIIIAPYVCFGQNFDDRSVVGEQYAKQAIKQTLKSREKLSHDTLINNKETAIAVAEPLLFKFYGKDNIISERPYELYLIDGYWFITGTLPKGQDGVVFEIIINSRNGQVIKLIHGK
jgi:hypothetical protein